MIYTLFWPLLLLLLLLVSTSQAQQLSVPSTTAFNLTGASTGYIFNVAVAQVTPLYITLSLCAPPTTLGSTPLPPTFPFALYVSNTSSQQLPGPSTSTAEDVDAGYVVPLERGFANVSLSSANQGGAWIGVWSPDEGSVGATSGVWQYELSISSDAPLVVLDGGASYKFEDSDASRALLTTSNWTSRGEDVGTPVPSYTAVVRQTSGLTSSLARSRCFVQGSSAGSVEQGSMTATQTTRGFGGGRRMQVEVEGLEKGTNYTSWLVETKSMGVRLWDPVYFRTKEVDNCRLVHSLAFCPAVAHSVPAPASVSTADLITHYNNTLSSSITNFTRTLSTFSCNSTTYGGYSFVSTCADCLAAYRTWTCAISLPRCTDPPINATLATGDSLEWTIPTTYQQTLLRANPLTSRTPTFAPDLLRQTFPSLTVNSSLAVLDQTPFPYAEVPPCLDTCHLVEARCPPFVGFQCPREGGTGTAGYGMTQVVDLDARMAGDLGGNEGKRAGDRFGNVFCNGLGTDLQMAVQVSAGPRAMSVGLGAGFAAVISALVAFV